MQSVDDIIKTAQTQLNEGAYKDAVKTIEYAVNSVELNRQDVVDLLDDAISHLSTLHGPAEPPHPAALSLIQTRASASL